MEIPNREEMEGRLARALGKLQKAQLTRLLELLGDPPRVENVPEAFWQEVGKELLEVLRPFLRELYGAQAEAMLRANPAIGVDWAMVNEAATEWARQYSYDLVQGINAHTRQALQRAVGSFFDDGLTRGELEERIAGLFGPVRAEMIAVTEVTRAAAEGQQGLVTEVAAEGIEMIDTWATRNDELVCPICGPLHGRDADGYDAGRVPYWIHPVTGLRYGKPPAHPRCRCGDNWRLPDTPATATEFAPGRGPALGSICATCLTFYATSCLSSWSAAASGCSGGASRTT